MWHYFVVEWTLYQQHKDFCIYHAHLGNVHNPNYNKNTSLKSEPVTELIKSSRNIGGLILYRLKVLLDSVPKGRDITLLTKVHRVTTNVVPVVTDRGKCWIIKKAEH